MSLYHWDMFISCFITVIISFISFGHCSLDVFQIPDQQAFLGKLFYYQISISSNVKNLTLMQAGYGGDSGSAQLPEWLHFDPDNGLLFGAPFEKKIYFIQVQAVIDELVTKTYDDIFVIEVLDVPAYLQTNHNGWSPFTEEPNRSPSYHCRIELKNIFASVKDLYQTVIVDVYRSFFSIDDDFLNSDDKVKKWLNQFNVANVPHTNNQRRLSFDVEKCNVHQDQNTGEHIYLDANSELLLKRLKKLSIENELIKISHVDELNIDFNTPTTTTDGRLIDSSFQSDSEHHHHSHHRRRSTHHRRRNAYADDVYSTPTLVKGVVSLTTSTIDLSANNEYILSRTLIPSMVSPTFAKTDRNNEIISTPTYPQIEISKESSNRNVYSHLYSTPVLLPNPTSMRTIDLINGEHLSTPVFPSIEPSMTLNKPVEPSTSYESPESSDVVETSIDTSSVGPNNTEAPTGIPNQKPFVNKRINKLSIIAGKYWQFAIPEDTFMDIEDGNTSNLNLGFFIGSKSLPLDFWIQFDQENKFLYALPTEENIGKYRFDLTALDSQGVSVTEVVEIFVRQSPQSLSYTHKFVLSDVTWSPEHYSERIQAVSTMLQRMATQVYEEVPGPYANDASQRQGILHRISVLDITKSKENKWTITWNNDSLRRHPCPENEINKLFSKLYDVTYPENVDGFMTPSIELKNALAPEFTVGKVKRVFVSKSACGNVARNEGSNTRQKDKIVFSNRLNRLGPYKLGKAFRFTIPKDTVYSFSRQVDASVLDLSLAPVEPEIYLPEFIYFDVKEKTIYGLPYKDEHVKTYELRLIAEDRLTGGSEQDLFVIDVVRDRFTREDYLFEVAMNFLIKNIEMRPRSQQKLTPKDYFEIANQISTKLMGNGNMDALLMLDISRHRLAAEPEVNSVYKRQMFVDLNGDTVNSLTNEEQKQLFEKPNLKKRRRSYHNLRFKRTVNTIGDYYYEFVWTNRSLVTSYMHSSDSIGGGSVFETETCPKTIIQNDIYERLFPKSIEDFMRNTNMINNHTIFDVKDAYSYLFTKIEANVEFLSVEWTPKSVCSNNPGLEPRVLGTKPIRDSASNEENEDDVEQAVVDHSPQPESVTNQDGAVSVDENEIEHKPTQQYLGDKLLAMIIPPIAILIALLFAVTIGCCFHRANLRRKAVGNHHALHEESPSLFRQRVPIRFEFERGRNLGFPNEQESMLDSKMPQQHPVQVLPMKRGPQPQNMPSQGRQRGPPGPHPNLPYQMLQQH